MEARLNYRIAEPDALRAMMVLESYTKSTGLDKKLVELMKIRASQLNGCAFCLDMHTIDARANGESEQRIYCLSAWRESPFYTDAERAALELTEAVTLISEGVSDEVYNHVRLHFSEAEFVQLVMVVNTINAWNRLSIATRAVPGNYQPVNHD
ncbi:carboxymuconolactone decarboxylase family protein [Alicyclobacillus ferrooxydans]|uniref:Carboxymuconolactone decarboxylase-like domain-containing protein n=1 Tax=Alicyclobacillus ferrooxydans TaxID=471514 RepID=A0A0P9EY41_9BACL|nr:carboxymuconolactone decarboxylase family protein [Alicyclobacillus ferrooxydans]KPV44058.1 hypothetical protein AN477_09200 [Alicyclobacillus ferrooxydans]